MCSDVFGPKFNADLLAQGIGRTLSEYGGLDAHVTNVVFVHGSLDPWHALGITEDLSPSAPAILIKVRSKVPSHGSDLIDMTLREPPTVPTSTQPLRMTLNLLKMLD